MPVMPGHRRVPPAADEHNRIDGYQLQGIWGGRRYGVK